MKPSDKGFASTASVVDAAWVAARRAGAPSGDDLTVLEWRWGPAGDDARGHLPGALVVDSDDFETGPPAYFLQTPDAIAAALARLGIARATPVVVYGDWALAAARGWWILRHAGVEDVRFLDGGLAAWVAAGGDVATRPRAPGPPRPFGATIPARPELLADTAFVQAVVDDPRADTLLVDVRSRAEFVGADSGYRSLEAKGRIPGAVWAGDAGGGPGSDYLRADGSLRSAAEIAALWTPLGITPDRPVVFTCGGGWRSSLACLYADLLGFSRARNHADGWFAWSTVFTPGPDGAWTQAPSGRAIAVGAPPPTPGGR